MRLWRYRVNGERARELETHMHRDVFVPEQTWVGGAPRGRLWDA